MNPVVITRHDLGGKLSSFHSPIPTYCTKCDMSSYLYRVKYTDNPGSVKGKR
jgi:hypothetical protein